MRRRVGEVATQFNPSKYEGVKNLKKVYGDVTGPGDNYIEVSKALAPVLTRAGFLKQLYLQSSPFLDIRNPSDYDLWHLKKSLNVDYHDIVSGAIQPILPKSLNAEIVIIASSYRGQNAVHAMHKMGYRNTVLATTQDVEELNEKEFFASSV
ncbi:hypothetical protein XU18_2017 [Perkinsela sp. CCAP 1560/4]|nr:hypothetical protein XU18_2017 [Perkinsela sp. CCAP 1560/4]|eukprot:KNH07485.1 hypothetical protein XU18_2017 [Perkinsela sp. CCAP 1560/4]